jgi:hypothetical protein
MKEAKSCEYFLKLFNLLAADPVFHCKFFALFQSGLGMEIPQINQQLWLRNRYICNQIYESHANKNPNHWSLRSNRH